MPRKDSLRSFGFGRFHVPSIAPIPFFEPDDNAQIPATILVVDSEEINRRLVEGHLQNHAV